MAPDSCTSGSEVYLFHIPTRHSVFLAFLYPLKQYDLPYNQGLTENLHKDFITIRFQKVVEEMIRRMGRCLDVNMLAQEMNIIINYPLIKVKMKNYLAETIHYLLIAFITRFILYYIKLPFNYFFYFLNYYCINNKYCLI